MKKLMVAALLMTMAVSLAACNKNESNTEGAANDTNLEAVDDEVIDGGAYDVEDEDDSVEIPKDASDFIQEDFTTLVTSGEYSGVEELATALLDADYLPFEGATMMVEPGFLNGFESEVEGFDEGCMFSPMIGSIPFVGYVFYVEDAGKVDSLVEELTDKYDMAWNVCTQADSMSCSSEGNYVCFVMTPQSFEE